MVQISTRNYSVKNQARRRKKGKSSKSSVNHPDESSPFTTINRSWGSYCNWLKTIENKAIGLRFESSGTGENIPFAKFTGRTVFLRPQLRAKGTKWLFWEQRIFWCQKAVKSWWPRSFAMNALGEYQVDSIRLIPFQNNWCTGWLAYSCSIKEGH